eukprot:CAMPEP_0172636054 /NCGR_PEP_ID=MMETSP1068-20121228/202201_1 /TAXON_ID=35684 /ORGANISM="Pseudopedinella elastica, Strain CCMP716" /LENGTH=110 /DNA_ID=CAMNT_0013448413 /DNA_START=61 /DNA_END=390 /DNA_ORIENTATION=+
MTQVAVAVRVRPLLAMELSKGHECTRTELSPADGIATISATGGAVRSFKFDYAADMSVSQEDFYERADIRKMVASALQGLNVTVLAYGQTGSGKTFTMEGPDDNFGVVPR